MSEAVQSTTTINVTLPDGSKREVPKGATPLDIAASISSRLAEAALAAKIKPSAPSIQHPVPLSGATGALADGDKSPVSMHAPQSKDGWQFADLTKPLEHDVELRLLTDRDP